MIKDIIKKHRLTKSLSATLIISLFVFLIHGCGMESPESLITQANNLIERKEYEKALKITEKLTRDEPNLAIGWQKRARILRNLGQYEESFFCYEEAIKLDSNYAPSWHGRAKTLYKLGWYKQALSSINRAIQIKESDTHWITKGRIFAAIGVYLDAIVSVDKALEINPKNANAWNNKGWYLMKIVKLDDAKKMLETALSIKPDYELAQKNLRDISRLKDAQQRCFKRRREQSETNQIQGALGADPSSLTLPNCYNSDELY